MNYYHGMKFVDFILIAAGISGLLLAFAGLAASPDAVNVVLVMLQFFVSGASLLVAVSSLVIQQTKKH